MSNTLASLDRQSEIMCFTEFKFAFRQTFSVPPTCTETFVNLEKNHPKDYSYGQKDQRDSRTRDSRQRYKSPHPPRNKSVLNQSPDPTLAVVEVTQTAGQVLHQ